ncbi:SUMF1/EgtB/PvdO family nonheme iron enzyme [Cystobacter ferrugineus]|uniref:SUMF1/EgtB/PvdO family nonheme iron enzyme n=1 Tax=Cystobacter ferrugineus TaxID=83449 RepID=UPI003CCBEB26
MPAPESPTVVQCDPLGNVFEWCRSTWKPCDVEFLLPLNKAAEWSGPTRVCRGGSWRVQALNARCANRYGERSTVHMDDIGFRVLFDEES